jgi:hypothetical protein
MKMTQNILVVFAFLGSHTLVNCTKERDLEPTPVKSINYDTITFKPAMKGWELYSWPNGNDWNYSILVGTNRLKSLEDVTTNRIIVLGEDSLKLLLDKIPENEFIFWISKEWLENIWGNNYGNLCLPDSNTINEIKNYCTQKGLVINIGN